jgi:hypothetical protein
LAVVTEQGSLSDKGTGNTGSKTLRSVVGSNDPTAPNTSNSNPQNQQPSQPGGSGGQQYGNGAGGNGSSGNAGPGSSGAGNGSSGAMGGVHSHGNGGGNSSGGGNGASTNQNGGTTRMHHGGGEHTGGTVAAAGAGACEGEAGSGPSNQGLPGLAGAAEEHVLHDSNDQHMQQAPAMVTDATMADAQLPDGQASPAGGEQQQL